LAAWGYYIYTGNYWLVPGANNKEQVKNNKGGEKNRFLNFLFIICYFLFGFHVDKSRLFTKMTLLKNIKIYKQEAIGEFA
jgi:hypothetical protein